MPTDSFVRFGPMEQQNENGFWWEDFKETLLENSRAVMITVGGIISLSLVAAMAAFFPAPFLFRWVMMAGALVLGSFHLWTIRTRLQTFTLAEIWVYTATVGFLLLLFVGLATYLFGAFYWLLPAATVCAFLLPVILQELWRLFGALPSTPPTVWYYTSDAPVKKSTTFLNSIPVKLQLYLAEGGGTERLAFQAPLRMTLGTLLFHSVQEGHGQGRLPIDLTDTANGTFGWVFYVTGLAGQRRYLHPDKGLAENRIRRNAVIHAQQVPPSETMH